jgi:hypothetical protein
VLGVAVGVALLSGLATLLFIVPGMIVYTMWFVAMPACIVERLGPSNSARRSAQLTRGCRWTIFTLWFPVLVLAAIVEGMLDDLVRGAGWPFALVVQIVWAGLWGAFYAVLAVVTYHDLRVAKEGVDTEQIAAVFD